MAERVKRGIHGAGVMKGEMQCSRKWLLMCILLVWCGSLGCLHRQGGGGTSMGSPGVGKAAAVVSPLVSRVDQRARLIEVNSLEINPPVVHATIKGRSLSPEEVQAMIIRVAQQIMTLKVTSGKAGVRGTTDSILRTEITQFQERNGSAFGGEPATVSFRMEIVDRARLKPIWEAQYFYRQEALSENLLRLGERIGPSGAGAGWVSGQVLLERGISASLEDFNRRREQQFLAQGK